MKRLKYWFTIYLKYLIKLRHFENVKETQFSLRRSSFGMGTLRTLIQYVSRQIINQPVTYQSFYECMPSKKKFSEKIWNILRIRWIKWLIDWLIDWIMFAPYRQYFRHIMVIGSNETRFSLCTRNYQKVRTLSLKNWNPSRYIKETSNISWTSYF